MTIWADDESGHPLIEVANDGHRTTLKATVDSEALATGTFGDVVVGLDIDLAIFGDAPAFMGYSFTQFSLPVRGSLTQPFDWSPAANLDSPTVVIPLLVRCADRVVLVAPLDSFHEQVISVAQTNAGITGFRWGWHGDLDQVPAGTTSTVGVYEGATASEVFAAWKAELEPTPNRRGADTPLLTHLSYWTDNGAAYWYRTEPGLDISTTLERTIDSVVSAGIGVGAVELDSWFYRHEVSRDVSETGYFDEVPPTGMIEWTARPDVLPDGVDGLRRRLADRPLVLHSRHISPKSDYLAEGDWWVDKYAHPQDPAFFQRWFDDARRWGATCIEQDWMSANWFGVRQLREAPGRAAAWLAGLDAAASKAEVSLMFCMSTPGDFMAACRLDNVVAARTSDDYRFADDPAFLWRWFLGVNRLAEVVGLPVFKDCFFSSPAIGSDSIDGDPHAEVEALLSALGGGVVGIGDRIGRTDATLLRRVCMPDGTLVKPARGLTLCDQSLFDTPQDAVVSWAEAGDDPWRYIVGLHMAESGQPVSGRFDLGGEYLVYDWRTETSHVTSHIEATLDYRNWTLLVCCPIEDGRAIIGDPTKFATMNSGRNPSNDRRWTVAM